MTNIEPSGGGGDSASQISALLQRINETEAKIAEKTQGEKLRSNAANLHIKQTVRHADDLYSQYLRQWEVSKRERNLAYEGYKRAKLERKRVDTDIKLAKLHIKNVQANPPPKAPPAAAKAPAAASKTAPKPAATAAGKA